MKSGVRIVLLAPTLLCLLGMGCGKDQKAPQRAIPAESAKSVRPAHSAPIRYHLVDTLETDVGPSFYSGSRLYRGTEILDTVSSGFGYSQFGRDSVVYVKIRLFNDTDWNDTHDTVRLVYHDGDNLGLYVFDGPNLVKTHLSPRLAYYSNYSNPIAAFGEVLYWGLRHTPGDTIHVYAMRYGLKSGATDSVFLYQDAIGTDDEEYFNRPIAKGNGYAFTTPAGKTAALDANFRILP
jgi:hypothetical protein